jgi:hypothetical protein
MQSKGTLDTFDVCGVSSAIAGTDAAKNASASAILIFLEGTNRFMFVLAVSNNPNLRRAQVKNPWF